MKKNQQIRNSTAEFLIFAMQGDAEGIEVRLEDDTVWLTQQMLAELYGTTKQNISLHILNIYEEEELSRESTVKDFLTVRNEGNRKVKTDVVVAKNYLKENELEELGRIVSAYLDLAENRAKRQIPMTMEDWARHLDRILQADDRELLQDAGRISAEIGSVRSCAGAVQPDAAASLGWWTGPAVYNGWAV